MREKLIDLLDGGLDKIGRGSLPWAVEMLADHLIANGVVIQPECQACAKATNEVIANLQKRIATDNNVGDKKQRFLLRENGDIVPLTICQKWIPVTERLPEDNKEVLVYCGSYHELGWYESKNKSWRSNFLGCCTDDITHWMPITEPPKGE